MLKSRKKLKLSESNLTPEKDNSQAYVFDEKEYIKRKKKDKKSAKDNKNSEVFADFDPYKYLEDLRAELEIVDDQQSETSNSDSSISDANDFEFERIDENHSNERNSISNSDEINENDDDDDDTIKPKTSRSKLKEKRKASKKIAKEDEVTISQKIDDDNIDDENELKKEKKRKAKGSVKTKKKCKLSKPKKVLRAIGISFIILGIGIGLYFGINNLLAYLKNQNPGTQDNFSNEEIIENNDNDLIFDDNGQIVVDPITDAEKAILVNSLTSKIILDANKRLDSPITSIDDIKLISLMPSNDCVGLDPENPNNEYDKYYLTLLFSSQGKTYQMSYLTGDEFQIATGSSDKNAFSDFVQYLQSSCAIDTCQVLDTNNSSSSSNDNSQAKSDILSLLDAYGYVGDVYYAFTQIGDLCYNIPVYIQNEDGTMSVKVYSCLAQYIDNYELDATETLAKELKGEALPPLPEGQAKYFTTTDVANQSSFTDILNIFDKFTGAINKEDVELQ